MNATELREIIELHLLWLKGEGGQRTKLQGADLQRADLREANLRGADLHGANLQGANLRGADLQWTNLQGTNLRGADLDFSCLPLWCGSVGVKVDSRVASQIAAHFCAMDCDSGEYVKAREALLEFARTSHRAKDLGL